MSVPLRDIPWSEHDPLRVAVGMAWDPDLPASLRLEAVAVASKFLHATTTVNVHAPAPSAAATSWLEQRLLALDTPLLLDAEPAAEAEPVTIETPGLDSE